MTQPKPASRFADHAVLIVEDEPRLREMLSRAVREMGLTVHTVGTAQQAQRAFAEKPYDVMLLDLNLPGIGGIDLLESIRGKGIDTETIILTGYGDLESAKKAIHFNAVEFLTKPCPLGTLEQAISKAVLRCMSKTRSREVHDRSESTSDSTGNSPATLADVERQHILAALAHHNGNRNAAAEELGISVRTLYYRLGQYERDVTPPASE